MRAIPQSAVDFIKRSEGVELRAYQDIAGVWTIGWGHVRNARKGLVITLPIAERYLREDLNTVAADLAATLKPDILARLTDTQYAALLSFGFNLGVNPKDGIWGVVNRGEFDRVPARMQLYNKARVNGQLVKVAGLTRRRQDEARLWEEGQGEDVRVTASAAETPPTPRDQPARKSATIWTTISAPVLGVVALVHEHVVASTRAVLEILTPDHVNQTLAAITPYAHKSAAVDGALEALAVLGAVLAAVLVLRKHRDARS